MKTILVMIAVLLSIFSTAQTTTENYIKSTTYQVPVTEGGQNDVNEHDKIETVQYIDGLGRPKQTVAVRASGKRHDVNLLDWQKDWIPGSGSTSFFNIAGSASHNQRVESTSPFGEETTVWRGGHTSQALTIAGWNSDTFPVDKNMGYRYSIWVKRTHAHSGKMYHGIWDVDYIGGGNVNNPYFFAADLPQTNIWYLLVGVVYPYTYSGGNATISGIYDTNGNKVHTGRDYKWKSTTKTTRLRDFLYNDPAISSQVEYWDPQWVQLDGTEPAIQQIVQPEIPQDIITHYEYDDYGRQQKSYLPYARTSQAGAIVTNPLSELNTFYNTDKYENTTNPFSEKHFESSPLHRVLEQGAPGQDWAVDRSSDTDHTIKFGWSSNIANEVVYFRSDFIDNDTETASLVKDGFYPEGSLYKTVVKDENWISDQTHEKDHTTEEFKNYEGQVILKRNYNNNIPHDTYYVYNVFGMLTFVIPPKVDVADDVSDDELDKLCYQYKYDRKNRLIEKNIPGKGWEYIVYNKLDQPVMTQDAIQRENNEWLFTKYDAFGRVAFTGLHTQPGNTARSTMQGYADDTITYSQWVNRTAVATIAGTEIYYDNGPIPHGITEIYTVNYYDDYEVGDIITFNPADGSGTWEGMTAVANVQGLPTVSQVKVLETDQWITNATYYDEKGRAWETHVKNDYLGTEDWVLNQLDFVGKVLKTQSMHIKNGNTLTTVDTFAYDHQGRLLKQTQQINGQPSELIFKNHYDALGQLETKKVGGQIRGNALEIPLQTIDYTYTIRGWLKGINDPDDLSSNDLFNMKIFYTDPEPSHVDKLYNGNISQINWMTANDLTKRDYKYSYDALNRMRWAYFWSASYYENPVYDKNGNITSMTRFGDGGPRNYMDKLTYTYEANSNKLLSVTDSRTENAGFIDGNKSGNDYEYDANGNMTVDRNKNVTNIGYNYMNLPTTIIGAPGHRGPQSITYRYSADGRKQAKLTNTHSIVHTLYSGNYIYEDNPSSPFDPEIKFIHTTEGYVEPRYDGPPDNRQITNFDYIYQYKDHLGNIRLSYADTDNDGKVDVLRNNTDIDGDGDNRHEIRQEKNYFPFGLEHKGYNNSISGRKHNYGFNGKEENDELGLKWLDFGARNYDASIGRWMSPDPLSEEFSSWSPYNSMMDNPINFIDPDGRAAFSPIYGTDGTFLGTDDQGLQGRAIVMEAENFEQGMSHENALSNNLGAEGLEDEAAASKLVENYNGLKDRPDYDGEITLSEANDWYRNGGGKPLFIDLAKVDLDFISSELFKGVGSTKPIQTLFDSEQGAIYGNVTFTYEGNNQVSASPDTYNFERHNRRSTASSPLTRIKENAKRGIRNAATVAGRIVADRSPFNLHNKEFKINFYGKGKISN